MQAQPQLVLFAKKPSVVVEAVCAAWTRDFDIWQAARGPVARARVSENMGPEAALTRAGDTFGRAGQAGPGLPQLAQECEEFSQMVAEGGRAAA